MNLLMIVILLLLACIAISICVKEGLAILFAVNTPGSSVLWMLGFGVLAWFCIRVALLLLSGAYPHD